MFITELKSLSILTSATQLPMYLKLYVTILGGKQIIEYTGMHIIEMGHQSIVEIYVEGTDYPEYLFQQSKQVLGFRTQQLETVYEAVKAAGFTLLSTIQRAGECYSYFHMTTPAGDVISIHQLLNNHNKH